MQAFEIDDGSGAQLSLVARRLNWVRALERL